MNWERFTEVAYLMTAGAAVLALVGNFYLLRRPSKNIVVADNEEGPFEVNALLESSISKIESQRDELEKIRERYRHDPLPKSRIPVDARNFSAPVNEGRAMRIDGAGHSPVDGIEQVSQSRSESRPNANAPPHSAPFSEQDVRQLYALWCRGGGQPPATRSLDIGSLHYESSEQATAGKRHLLRDANQMAEFVRFSKPESESGLVFPNPDALFTPVVAYLFPGLTRTDYAQKESFAEIAPVSIKRVSSSRWVSE